MRYYPALLMLLVLPSCFWRPDNGNNEAVKRVDAKQTCEAMGYLPGNAQFNECILDEKARRAALR